MSTVTQEPSQATFEFPSNLEPGMRVVVSMDPNFASKWAGIIANIEGNGAMIFFFGGNSNTGAQFGPLEDCWYEGDPRITTHQHLIGQDERRGVFRLADSEERIQVYAEQFKAIEELVARYIDRGKEMERRVMDIEHRLAAIEKPRGGRPRKDKPETEEDE